EGAVIVVIGAGAGLDRARHRERHRLSIARSAAATAEADADRGRARAGCRDITADVETAATAATADGLGKNCTGVIAERHHIADDACRHVGRVAAAAARSTKADADRTRRRAAEGEAA